MIHWTLLPREQTALFSLLLIATASACGSDGAAANGDCGADCAADGGSNPNDADSGGPNAGIPCDVQRVLRDKCQNCHGDSPQFGAPIPLTRQAHFEALSTTQTDKKTFEVAQARIQPGASGAMPPVTSPALSEDERATLEGWLAAEAPISSERCQTGGGNGEPTSGAEIDTTGLECYRLLAHAGDANTPYHVGTADDAYLNFVFDPPWDGAAYGVVLRPIIDNSEVIHHWLLYEDVQRGEPAVAERSDGAHPDGRLLYGWAPGADAVDFRQTGEDVGLELADTTYTMEYHYNSRDPEARDASGVEICVARDKPEHVAALSWLGFELRGTPSASWTGTCTPQSSEPIHIVSLWPHMHLKGRHMTAVIQRADGSEETLHDSAFDFNYQRMYAKDVSLQPGDSITTTCTFDGPASFGTRTSDEMCYLFTMAYPRGALSDGERLGQLVHGDGSCLGQ